MLDLCSALSTARRQRFALLCRVAKQCGQESDLENHLASDVCVLIVLVLYLCRYGISDDHVATAHSRPNVKTVMPKINIVARTLIDKWSKHGGKGTAATAFVTVRL
jgi:hypothetical protein